MNHDPPSDSSTDSVTWSQWFGMALFASAILAGLEFMVYRALTPVERGEAATAATWAPIAIVYELWGYGAALSIIPVLWLLFMGIVAWQTWNRLRAEELKMIRPGPQPPTAVPPN